MSDPNNPTPNFVDPGNQAQVSAMQIQQFNAVIQESVNGFNIFNQKADFASRVTDMFADKIAKAKNYLLDPNLTSQGANAFEVLGTAVMGASKSFDALSDTTSLSNFSSQIEYTVASTVSGAKSIGGVITGLVKAAKDLGVPTEAISNIMNKANAPIDVAKGLSQLIKNMGQAADGALKFQNSYFSLMSTTGQVNQVFEQAGDKLENLNSLLQDQSRMITGVYGATGVALPMIVKYYEALGKIPGTLQMQVASGGDASKSVSMLQETIQLAHGTGRAFEEVVKDLATAWELYNLKGEQAEIFTARMTELSNNFGIRIQDTEGFVTKMAESFKMLGNNTEGTAKIFNQFFGELQRGGLGVKPAMEVIEQMTGAIGRMSLAQRSFLSSRTGGPGGLLGAVEIERDLRAGNVDKVFDRMRQSLQQQFGGRIVTQDQVHTQQDASQFQRQRMLLQSGAFGNIASNDEQATRILEALAHPGQKELQGAKDLLRQQVDRGSTVEQKSFTQLVEVNKHLEEIKMQGGIRALGIAQNAFTAAGTGEIRRRLESNVADSSKQGAAGAVGAGGQDASTMYANQALTGLFKSTKDLTMSFESAKKAASEAFVGPKSSQQIEQDARDKYNVFFNQLQQQRQAVQSSGSSMSNADRRAALQRIQDQEDALKTSLARIQSGPADTRAGRVGEATNASLQHTGSSRGTPTQATPSMVSGPGKAGEKLDLTVNVYVGDKKHVSQQQVQLDGGIRIPINGQ